MANHKAFGGARLFVLAALVLVLAGVGSACSSSSEGSDPTTTAPTLVGTVAPGDEDGGGDEGGTGTTIDEEPRVGTTLLDPEEDPPTGDETQQDYIDALLASFEEDPDELFTSEDVACIAPLWVSAIGVDGFQAAGVTPADIREGSGGIEDLTLDEDTAGEVVDAFPECGLDLMQLFLEGLPARVRDDAAALSCIEGTVTEAQIRSALIDEIRGAEGPDPEDLAGTCLE